VLAQTIQPLEIILVDDGSTDNSAEVAKKYLPKVELISQENRGIAGARNTGIRNSKGETLAFLDNDDIWPYDHLEKLFALLRQKELHMAFGHVEQFISEDADVSETRIPDGQPTECYLAL